MGGMVGFVAMLMLLSRSVTMSAPSCSSVVVELTPCLAFLKGSMLGGGQPSGSCCSGVKEISGKTKSKQDTEAVCQCIKQALSHAGSYSPSRIPLLSKKCGVEITLPPINKNTDCSK
ncbi:non-specific lipid-transfer protein-like [Malania oleifera]|uniref:non-specific lipid-transfer protein-like n=1 Tax=Malania oleifera TaxID=397392 RepID=UPI0025ADFAD9|nr:non-specific lipid-transfer protein-like [Malania oleifera]